MENTVQSTQMRCKSFRFTPPYFKLLIVSCLIVMGLGSAKAQTLDPVPNYPNPMIMIRESVRNMFLPITPHVNHPILYNMGVGVIDTLYHKPVLHDTLYGNADIWFRSYEQFRQATIDTSTVVPLDTIVNNVYSHPKDTIPLLVLAKSYKYFPDKVFELDSANNPFDIDTVNDALYPRNIALMQAKLKETYCFMVAPSYDNLTRPKFVFKFDPQFFFVDAHLVQEFIDKGGIRIKVTPTDSFTITNFTAIQYFEIDRTDTIADTLVAFSARVQKSGSNEVFGFHKTLGQISNPNLSAASLASIPFNQLGLVATKYPACESSNFKKALIYIEGIDILDQIKGSNRDGYEIYNYQVHYDSLSLLRSQGYDIWVIDWKNSCLSMGTNATYLVNFLNFLKNDHYNNTELEPFVIIGESMGGVIARHALLLMEKEAEDANDFKLSHNVRTLITLDSPHKGAHIPMSFQIAYTAVRPAIYAALGLTSFVNPIINVFSASNPNYAGSVFQVSDLLNKPAVKELLISHIGGQIRDGLMMETEERQTYLQTLEDLGNYPKYCKLIAITNGSLNGTGQKSLITENSPSGRDLFSANLGAYIRILGIQFKIIGTGIHLKTNSVDSDVTNPLFGISLGTYKPRIRFQGLRMIVKSTYLPLLEYGAGIPTPELCYKAGGYQTYITKRTIQGFNRNLIDGVFQSNWFPLSFDRQIERADCFRRLRIGVNVGFGIAGTGIEGEICSASPNWNFIPVESALDDVNGFSSGFSTDYWSMPIQDKLDRIPFDAIMGPDYGLKTENINGIYITSLSEGKENHNHLNVPNNKVLSIHEECKFRNDGFFLNKEIGTKNIWINNWTIPSNITLHVYQSIENKVMRLNYSSYGSFRPDLQYNWETPSIPFDSNRTFGLYSKERQATTTSTGSVRLVYLENEIILDPLTNEKLYNIAPIEPSKENDKEVKHCCIKSQVYAPRLPSAPLKNIDCEISVLAYPNPSINGNSVRIPYYEGNEVTRVELFDTYGRCLNAQVKTDSKSYLVETTDILNGVYILHIYTTNCTFTQKLIIQ